MQKQSPPLTLHIERVILDGFKSLNKQHIHDAIADRLSELFSSDMVSVSFQHHGFVSKIDAGSIQLNPKTNAKEVGIGVANAVYRGLKK